MSLQFIKKQATRARKLLPAFVAQYQPPFSHAQCLELVSQLHGFPHYHAAQQSESQPDKVSTSTNDEGTVGPWYCDACSGVIATSGDGYVIWHSAVGDKAHGFRIVHRVVCDPRGSDYGGSLALDDFIGDRGLAKVLSFIGYGPLKAERDESNARVRYLEEIVDLIRRVQSPRYEQARRYFDDPLWRERLSDVNEYAAYVPEALQRMLTWPVSSLKEVPAHLDLEGEGLVGEVEFDADEPLVLDVDEAVFGPLVCEIGASRGSDAVNLHLQFCADGRFRAETSLLVDDEEVELAVDVGVSEVRGTDVLLEGTYREPKGEPGRVRIRLRLPGD